jgi:hypothetical protein
VFDADGLTDDFDRDRLDVPDLPCDFDLPLSVDVPLFVFFDLTSLVEAGRLLNLLFERVPLTLLLLPVERIPLTLDGLAKFAACLIKS